MNKKLLALAIAAALAPAAAMADSGNVVISGSLHMSVDSLNGNSGSAANNANTDNERATNVSSNNSWIAFSGDESLGNGLKAVWKLTTVVGMGDTGATSGTNSWTNGNSYLGVAGGFGTAILGKHDTPFKMAGRSVDLFADQIGDARNLTAYADGANNLQDLRPSNVIAYISPEMSGFSGILAYVTNTNVTALNANTGAIATSDAGAAQEESVTAFSASGKYASGPIMVGLAYERLNLSNVRNLGFSPVSLCAAVGGTSTAISTTAFASCSIANPELQDQSSWRLVGGYNFGDFKVVGLYQTTKNIDGADGLKRKMWGLGGAYKMGATTIKAQYYKANDATGEDGLDQTGANLVAVGADYSLSKRTTAYVAYARTSNEDDAAFSAFGGGHGDNPGTVTGKNPSGFSLGMKHSF